MTTIETHRFDGPILIREAVDRLQEYDESETHSIDVTIRMYDDRGEE